ncbi:MULTISPECIES: DUF3796 domain-containing protein [unclassified Clostridioides]|uniref:DUF3796 domain-containing protein n=1 Tax=unclassified Clostridioides TaxID=2635829 RepID=UPI001D0C8BA3|nr:DUF3796 domain-containing protein [Clostridioides sp. ES-S-0001-02]MCC0640014.1 DUF3796 domain-containing protein [Clostridioides sp. ES-S-0049-03]MCC0655451.1 DUF3796 domain-containing protein [Clostridioides sp. ES-S-0123-01]MCC0670708.1 DUF3796 domain-containing protein [Clostridioides sp. ES-S-0145-01]MCC0674766.1 DUF3796 domain-containing protein [Clostridioides sp. ES-W-0018-02]MCC0679294.1 DUF3796 domain-containing protein [Clostridioides sp. ES-S-0005-03]MCC0696379.1 DUF3796 domain
MKSFRELNKLGFLGFLGFLGLAGIYAGEIRTISFCAFFVFFRYFNIMPDELFRENLRKAAVPAFFFTLSSLSVAMVLSIISDNISTIENGLGISFSISMISFVAVFAYLQYKEGKGLE